MTPTPNQITECTDERQLCEWAAVYCMGWTEIPEHHSGFKVFECSQQGYIRDWQPTSPTEKGKAQCWDLIVKYKLLLLPYNHDAWGAAQDTGKDITVEITEINPQIAVVKAAIIAALNGEEL